MKKSLLCAAVALACSPAFAADVQLFGFFDQGIAFLNENLAAGMGGPNSAKQQTFGEDQDKIGMAGRKNQVSLGTGNVSTWGIKLTEQINDDFSVGIHLENGYLPDTGELYMSNVLFERESTIALNSKTYGQLKMGRMPAMLTGSGTTGIFNSRVNPFGAGWGNMTGGWKFVGTLASARHDNMFNYRSPSFNGVTFHVQHSFGNTDENVEGTEEGSSKVNRYSALGVTVEGDRYFLAAGVDYLKMGSKKATVTNDSIKAIVGGHYDFGSFKGYATAQYMDNIQYIGGYSTKEFAPKFGSETTKGFDAWAVSLGADTKVWGGTAKFSVGYAQAENQNLDDNKDMVRMNLGIGYVYPLSKRTSIYGIGGYFWEDADYNEDKIYASEVIVGLMHRF